MATRKSHKDKRGFITYPNLHFRHQDPLASDVMAEARGYTDKQIKEESGVSLSTMRNIRTKKTAEPRGTTYRRILRAVGKDLFIGNMDDGRSRRRK